MKHKIALFNGDGVGPELIAEGKKVIEKAAELDKFEVEWKEYPHSAEHYIETKRVVDDDTLADIAKDCSAVYCGTFGDPKVAPGILEKGILGRIKGYFDQFITMKPIRLYPNVEGYIKDKTHNDVNFILLRENVEDFYIGLSGRAKEQKTRHVFDLDKGFSKAKLSMGIDLEDGELAYQIGALSLKKCQQMAKFAFEQAKIRGIEKITSVDKANIINSHSIWREAFESSKKNYGMIELEFELIDSAIMNFIRQPEKYKMVVAPNMIGDVLSDLGNIVQGGLAFSSTASINPKGISMFEPSHGSAPKLREKGIVNPIATIIAGAMMLENIGQRNSGSLMMKSVESVLKEGMVKTQDLNGNNTTEDMGDAITDKFIELHD